MMASRQKTERQAILTVAHKDYEKGLNLYAFFKTRDHAAGEDLVQDTFMKTWKYLVRGGEIHLMKAFLYHILNNLIVDTYRRRKTSSLDTLVEKGFEPPTENHANFLDVLDGKALVALLIRLPEKYRKVMHMRYMQGLSLKEMSLITGQSKNAMAVQVHRGLEKLKLLYKPIITKTP